ncbi:MAG: SHOCT domain-containing protein [Rhizomicrobium sp.]
MAVTALYTLAMSPAEAFEYSRGALAAAGAAPGTQSPPTLLEFSLTQKDLNLGGSLAILMPGRAIVAASGEARSTVTVSIEPATQFILYAAGIGLVALLFGNWFLGGLGGLWFLLVLGGEAYLVWAAFNKWPNDALAAVHARMRQSEKVDGGVQPAAPSFAPPATAAGVAEQIRHLAELRDQGHLTQDEFDAKKAELLKRI